MAKKMFYRNVHLFLALGIVIVAWGFSGSYFGKLGQTTLPYHIHGISASLWMILLVVQPYLYRQGKIKTHRYLGWTSVVLVPVIVGGGCEMMVRMIAKQEIYPPGVVYQLAFIDAVTLLGFVGLFLLAIRYRKRLKLHARFMVCTIFGPLIPALTRLFFSIELAHSFNQSLTLSYGLTEAVLLLIIWNERREREMKLTYLPVLLFVVAQHALMYFAGHWEWWIELMDQMAGIA